MTRPPAPTAVLERLEIAVEQLHDLVVEMRAAVEQNEDEGADGGD